MIALYCRSAASCSSFDILVTVSWSCTAQWVCLGLRCFAISVLPPPLHLLVWLNIEKTAVQGICRPSSHRLLMTVTETSSVCAFKNSKSGDKYKFNHCYHITILPYCHTTSLQRPFWNISLLPLMQKYCCNNTLCFVIEHKTFMASNRTFSCQLQHLKNKGNSGRLIGAFFLTIIAIG